MARAGAGRVAGLGHEARDDAVEDDAVIETLLHQRLDLRHVLGGEIGPQADRDAPVLGVEIDNVLRVGALRESRASEGERGASHGGEEVTANEVHQKILQERA